MKVWGIINRTILLLSVSSIALSADQLYTPSTQQAYQALANKLNFINYNDLDAREGSFAGYQAGVTNPDDENPTMSTSTYHSFTFDYCKVWAGVRQCLEWIHPYDNLHGREEADRSPAEGVVADFAEQNKNSRGPNQFSIWDVTSNGAYLKSDGTVDREALTSWRVKKPLVRKLDNVGYKTASQAVWRTYDKKDQKNPYVMPNMEGLRTLAGRFTKMMRNRFVANIGSIRAMQPGIEFATGGGEIVGCQGYQNRLQQQPDRTGMEQRIDPQNNLSLETRVLNPRLQDRAKLCEQMMKMSAYAVNPRVYGQQIKSAGAKGEWIDAALYRANLAAIDYAGADPRQIVAIDPRIKISDADLTEPIAQYANGGKSLKTVAMNNWGQMQLYNNSLKNSKVALDRAAAQSTGVQGAGNSLDGYALQKGGTNEVMLNDLSPGMRQDLKGTNYKPARAPASSPEPGNNLEMNSAKLMVKQLR